MPGQTMQILVELLVAAAFGGAIGWALHIMYLKRQAALIVSTPGTQLPNPVYETAITELEGLNAKAQANIDDLHRRSGLPRQGEEGAPPPEGSLAWRNRHLESRVRFLEGKLADVDGDAVSGRLTEDQNDEATRLRWRNRYLEGRVKYLEEELVRTGGLTPASVMPATKPSDAAQPKAPEGDQPELLDQPRGGKSDDLKQISGIGPKLEQKLNSLGIWHYDQVASWSQGNIDWVNAAISFRGRIEREKWAPQANALLQGAPAQTPAPETEDSPG